MKKVVEIAKKSRLRRKKTPLATLAGPKKPRSLRSRTPPLTITPVAGSRSPPPRAGWGNRRKYPPEPTLISVSRGPWVLRRVARCWTEARVGLKPVYSLFFGTHTLVFVGRKPLRRVMYERVPPLQNSKKGTKSERLRRPLCVRVSRALQGWDAFAHSFLEIFAR